MDWDSVPMSEFVYSDERDDARAPASEEEIAAVREKIRAWYESGVPFFTKKRLQHIQEQIQNLKANKSGNITFEDLDGQFGERYVEIGKTYYDFDRFKHCGDTEADVIGVAIAYRKLYHMLNPDPQRLSSAYRNINMFLKFGPPRKKDTNELLYQLRDDISLEETEKQFQAARQKWESSKECKQLETLLVSKPHLTVNKVVVFTCASMSDHENLGSTDLPWRATYQHALAVTLCKIFNRINEINGVKEPMQCYAQDERYGDADKSVLAQNGITVLEDPAGFLQLDDKTAVVSIAELFPIGEIICDISKPAVLIRYEVGAEGARNTSDAHSPRVWKLIEEQYECHDFLGGFEVSGLLTRDCYNGVMVYTRKDEQVASAADA